MGNGKSWRTTSDPTSSCKATSRNHWEVVVYGNYHAYPAYVVTYEVDEALADPYIQVKTDPKYLLRDDEVPADVFPPRPHTTSPKYHQDKRTGRHQGKVKDAVPLPRRAPTATDNRDGVKEEEERCSTCSIL